MMKHLWLHQLKPEHERINMKRSKSIDGNISKNIYKKNYTPSYVPPEPPAFWCKHRGDRDLCTNSRSHFYGKRCVNKHSCVWWERGFIPHKTEDYD